MIEFMPESTGNMLGIKATGKLTDADYKKILIPKLEEVFAKEGKLNILCHMDKGFEGWDLEAAWDDASFGLRHRSDFERMALVGGPAWVEWCAKLSGFLMKGEIRTFPKERMEEAWAWIKG